MSASLPTVDRRLILSLLCLASFSVAFNNMIVAPLLADISEDFGVRVAVAGLMVTVYAIVASIAAVFAGPVIDRLGRRIVVITGMAALTMATAASALAPTFTLLLLSRALGGLGAACLAPAVFAAVGDYFAYEERGRAVSWVMSANTVASIVGVPVGAVISSFASWRFTFLLLALLTAGFLALLARKLPGDERHGESSRQANGLTAIPKVLRDAQAKRAMFANYLGTSYWFILMTYVGAYFDAVFGFEAWAIGIITMVMGVGILGGSTIGGRLGDRVGKRVVILWSSSGAAVFIAMATTIATSMPGALACILLFTFCGGARFSNAQAMLTELVPANRGTVMALNASLQQLGIVTGSVIGGVVLATLGYQAIGPAAAALALASLTVYGFYVVELGQATPAEMAPELVATPEG